MPVETTEQRIRDKAYYLWQEDGSMEGCADEYWRKARSIVEAEIAEENVDMAQSTALAQTQSTPGIRDVP